jgi:hypothetical protein
MEWLTTAESGNFKWRVNPGGNKEFYPLFQLVSLKETDISMGVGLDKETVRRMSNRGKARVDNKDGESS